jgi:hypothetical protein
MQNNNETVLVSRPQSDIYNSIDQQLLACEKMGGWLAKSGLAGCTKLDQGYLLAFTCLAERKTPLQICSEYDIISTETGGSRLCLKTATMQARYLESGGKINYRESTPHRCIIDFSHPKGSTLTVDLSMQELIESGVARTAKGLKPTYHKHPRQMLRARALAEGIRATYPAVLSGCYAAEELDQADQTETEPAQVIEAGAGAWSHVAEVNINLRDNTVVNILNDLRKIELAESINLSEATCRALLEQNWITKEQGWHADGKPMVREALQSLSVERLQIIANNWEKFARKVRSLFCPQAVVAPTGTTATVAETTQGDTPTNTDASQAEAEPTPEN